MRSKLIHDAEGQRTFAIVLDSGDEAMACLKQFAAEQQLTAASFKAIGAFRAAELSFFNWETKAYEPIPVAEQVEVASLTGDVAVSLTASRPFTCMPFLASEMEAQWLGI